MQLLAILWQLIQVFNQVAELVNLDMHQRKKGRQILALESILRNFELLIQKFGALLFSVF